MNKKYNDIFIYFSTFKKLIKKDKTLSSMSNICFGIAPTYIGLLPAMSLTKNKIDIIAQDVSIASNGAYTGQVAANQLAEYNIKHCLVGHSETRMYQAVTDEIVNKKVLSLLENKMIPIICIGETKNEFDKHKTTEVLSSQVKIAFKDVGSEQAKNIIIAYEPVWAIGTSLTPTSEQIKQSISDIRKQLSILYNVEISNEVSILYGGSTNSKNAASLLLIKGVDGLLVGGASLDPKDFYKIITSCEEYKNKINEENNNSLTKNKFISFFKKMFLKKSDISVENKNDAKIEKPEANLETSLQNKKASKIK